MPSPHAPESTILFVGYQANGTLGRAIYEGAKEVRLFGETIEVKAKIDKFIGISGHYAPPRTCPKQR